MSFIASVTGLAVGFVVWCIGSYLISLFIYWGATRANPMSEKALKSYELLLCGLILIVSLGIFFMVARAMWPEPS